MALGVIGTIIRLFANLGGYNGVYALMAIGHTIVGISVVFLMITSFKYLVLNTH